MPPPIIRFSADQVAVVDLSQLTRLYSLDAPVGLTARRETCIESRILVSQRLISRFYQIFSQASWTLKNQAEFSTTMSGVWEGKTVKIRRDLSWDKHSRSPLVLRMRTRIPSNQVAQSSA